MYENGEADAADQEKYRLEAKQRDARKVLEQTNEKWTPLWFSNSGGGWEYDPKKDYFGSRGKFSSKLNIFND